MSLVIFKPVSPAIAVSDLTSSHNAKSLVTHVRNELLSSSAESSRLLLLSQIFAVAVCLPHDLSRHQSTLYDLRLPRPVTRTESIILYC